MGIQLSSPGKRFGASLLDGLLALVTLGIGSLIWSIVLWAQGRGQTPAKQILKMRVVRLRDGKVATFGTMALRELVGKFLVGLLAAVTIIGLVLYFWLVWDKDNQELWDKMAGTVVVDDPQDVLNPSAAQAGALGQAAPAGALPPTAPAPPPPAATPESVPAPPPPAAAPDSVPAPETPQRENESWSRAITKGGVIENTFVTGRNRIGFQVRR